MFFNVSGHEVKVEVEKKKVFLSKHSERKLKKFKIHFQVYNPLKIPKTVTSIDDKKKWNVIDSYRYYTEGNPVVRYIFEIEEIEELNIRVLHLGELQIKPDYYQEEIDGSADILLIKAGLILDNQQWEYLSDLYKKGPVTIKREGISLKPKKMIFNRLIWSQKSNNEIKCALSLVEDKVNHYRQMLGSKVEIENLKKVASFNQGSIAALIEILTEKKILNDQDLEKINKMQKTLPDDLQYIQVEDLDDFLKKYKI